MRRRITYLVKHLCPLKILSRLLDLKTIHLKKHQPQMAFILRKADGKTDLLMQSMTSKLKNKSSEIIQHFSHSVNVFFTKYITI